MIIETTFKQIDKSRKNMHLSKLLSNKRTILFGVTPDLEKWIAEYKYWNINPVYIVDHDPAIQNQLISELLVKSPHVLKFENLEDVVVIITKETKETINFLNDLGFILGENIIDRELNTLYSGGLIYGKHNLLATGHSTRNGGLYHINLKNNSLNIHMEGKDLRGICKDDLGYTVVDADTIYCLDHNFIPYFQRKLGGEQSNFHGIAYSTGLYYLIDSSTNTILVISKQELEVIKKVNFSKNNEDIHHINDIHVDGDHIYVSMISLTGARKEFWAKLKDGAIIKLDRLEMKIQEIVKEKLYFPHSVRVIDGSLLYCESFESNFCDGFKEIARFNGFTRGIEFDGMLYYIGQSTFRRKYNKEQLEHTCIDTGIHVFDPIYKISKFISTPADIYGLLLI
jgi:hypothetical protein